MQFAPSGLALTFEVTYDAPDLFVGMSIIDVTAPSPVAVVGPVLMTNIAGTNTYTGRFQPLLGHSYLISKIVYTDAMMTTADPNYMQSSETIVVGGVDISYVVPTVC